LLKLRIDKLPGSLTAHEMTLQGDDEETTRKNKGVELKSSHKLNSESEISSEDEDMALLMKQFKKFI